MKKRTSRKFTPGAPASFYLPREALPRLTDLFFEHLDGGDEISTRLQLTVERGDGRPLTEQEKRDIDAALDSYNEDKDVDEAGDPASPFDEWKKVGTVSVDAGMVLIADPCRVLHREKSAKSFGKDWSGFLAQRDKAWAATRVDGGSLRFDGGADGLAVVSGTGFGDGSYDVWGRFDAGSCEELRISFDGLFGGRPKLRPEYCEVEGCRGWGFRCCQFPVKAKGWKPGTCGRWICNRHCREREGLDLCPQHKDRLVLRRSGVERRKVKRRRQ